MTSSLENPIDDLLPLVAAAVESWRVTNTPKNLKQKIFARLDKSRDEIVLKLLGFSSEYGGYTLDHCNGRSGNSPAGEFLKNAQADAIREWLKTTALPELTGERRISILKGMEQQYERLFREGLSAALKEKAKKDVDAVMDKISESHNIDRYMQVLGLINADKE